MTEPTTQPQVLGSLISNFISKIYSNEKIRIFLLGLVIGGLLTYAIFSFDKNVEVKTDLGTFNIKSGNTQNAIFLLNPAGEKGTPWVATGIKVKKGDKLKISATGKIHLALKSLNLSILFPYEYRFIRKGPGWEWIDPGGLPEEYSAQIPPTRNEFKILKDQKYGKLLLSIRNDEEQILEPRAIGIKQDEISINHDGEIMLTVNDIWLNDKAKDAYVPPKSNSDYYLREARQFAVMKGDDFSKWSPTTELQKEQEQYIKREKDWNTIKEDNKWNAWYEDNIGSFSVSITVNK
jgi:hypothetical protein